MFGNVRSFWAAACSLLSLWYLWAIGCGLALTTCFLAPPAWSRSEGWGEVTALAFLPDGKTAIAACQEDNKLRIYDVATGKERTTIDAHKYGVWAAVPSPDGKYVATGGGDNLVKLWDTANFTEVRRFTGHTKEVLTVAFSPDGKLLASGGGDRTIRIWDAATGKQIKIWHGHELKVLSVAFSPDGRLLASAGLCTAAIPGFVQGATHSDQVRLFEVQTGKEVRKLAQRGTTVCFTPDGRALAAAGCYVVGTPQEGGTAIVNRGTKASLAPIAKDAEWMAMKGIGSALALSRDGSLLVLAFGSRVHLARPQGKFGRNFIEDEIEHHRISIWETATGKEIVQLPEESITMVAISPNCKKLAIGSLSGQVRFRNLEPEGWPYAGKTPNLTVKNLEKLWADLAREPAGPAYTAIWTLSAAGNTTVAFLKEKLQPQKSTANQVKDLLTKLDSDKYAVREAAFRDLKKLGPAIEVELRQTVAQTKASIEVRKRVQSLLNTWEKRPASPDELRETRALQVLERIATPEAREVMARLAAGEKGAWLTEQAGLAVKRLQGR